MQLVYGGVSSCFGSTHITTRCPCNLSSKQSVSQSVSQSVNQPQGLYPCNLSSNQSVHHSSPSTHPPTHPPTHNTGLKRPNGLAFSPDFHALYVANSDADDPKWIALAMDPQTGLPTGGAAGGEPRLLASAKAFQKADGSRVGNP